MAALDRVVHHRVRDADHFSATGFSPNGRRAGAIDRRVFLSSTPSCDGELVRRVFRHAPGLGSCPERRSCPQVAGLVIDAVGWRFAYVGLAVAVLLVAFPPVAMFLREPPGFEARARRPQQPAVSAAAVLGVAAGEALRSWLFWELAIAFFLDVIAINGTLTQIVPLLTDRGLRARSQLRHYRGPGSR